MIRHGTLLQASRTWRQQTVVWSKRGRGRRYSNAADYSSVIWKGLRYPKTILALTGATAAVGGITYVGMTQEDIEEELEEEEPSGLANYVFPSMESVEEKKEETDRSWRGLDILRASISAAAIASSMSTWSWPKSLSVDFDFSWLQNRLNALFLELSLGPGSFYAELVDTPPDPNVYPEVEWDACVRLGEDICLSERAFLSERKRAIRVPFAKLLGVDPEDVDERDVPIVAIAGSGGGYRAMLMTAGSLVGAESSGLLSCVTYTAGVSGSCWALGVMYSGVVGSVLAGDTASYLKDRIQVSYLEMGTLDALVSPPTNRYLLAGLLRKAAGPAGSVSLVDIYGTLLGSRLFVPSSYDILNPQHLSLHMMRRHIDKGEHPMPIFTAIQHTFPPVAIQAMRELQAEEDVTFGAERVTVLEEAKKLLKESSSQYLWYEFTPYEVGCDEIGAWIPSWAFGRRFLNGKSIERRPGIDLTILSGIFGSAFCASLKLYFQEIRTTLDILPSQLYNWLVEIMTDNEEDLGLIHPVMPDQVPNFLRGLDGQLRFGSPPDLTDREYMTFMDAGAELNIPYYPLLRRNVDCIIALDASADSQNEWFTRAEELAVKRGLRTWPKGAGWPVKVVAPPPEKEADDEPDRTVASQRLAAEEADANANADAEAARASRKLAETQQSALAVQADRKSDTDARGIPDHEHDHDHEREQPVSGGGMSTCEVWIGSSQHDASDSSRLDDLDEDALLRRDGIGIVYVPLAANDARVPGFDPFSVSTWRRELRAEESQGLLDVSEANFGHSQAKIVRLLRAIWRRKKHERERREWRERLLAHFYSELHKDFA
ncbi:FabD/lysophospholipase-like protein [Trametopsis cervina]|nr:FabD/lysophospholipase-like protein [Trametopsis cervina]